MMMRRVLFWCMTGAVPDEDAFRVNFLCHERRKIFFNVSFFESPTISISREDFGTLPGRRDFEFSVEVVCQKLKHSAPTNQPFAIQNKQSNINRQWMTHRHPQQCSSMTTVTTTEKLKSPLSRNCPITHEPNQ